MKKNKNKNKNVKKLSLGCLGGLGEIGKNCMVVEYDGKMIVIDAGLMFPEEGMLGIDCVIPDFSYIINNKDRVKAVFLTHGHEDHIGGLPYLLKGLDVPVYGSKFTTGLAKLRIAEHGIRTDRLIAVDGKSEIKIEDFSVRFIMVNHSIVDGYGIALKTPYGTVIHTGDFKIDQTPIDGRVIDLTTFAEFGKEGVELLLSDSTNAERKGFTHSESKIKDKFNEIISKAKGKVIIATFSSNIHRIQQAYNCAVENSRSIVISGMQLKNNSELAVKLGLLNMDGKNLVDVERINSISPDKLVVIVTGTQGESYSVLSRIAMNNHENIRLNPGDTVIISASVIPGNENTIRRTVDNLFKLGAEVHYSESTEDVHVSGHAYEEELKLMLNLVKPKYFMPVHGEIRQLKRHSAIAESVGIPKENIFVAENGRFIELNGTSCKFAGKIHSSGVFVDGKGVGDVGHIVLRDRRHLSEDGLVAVVMTVEHETGKIIAGPDLISRGFVYVRESEPLFEEARNIVRQTLESFGDSANIERSLIKSSVRANLGNFLHEKTERRPMILPIIMEV